MNLVSGSSQPHSMSLLPWVELPPEAGWSAPDPLARRPSSPVTRRTERQRVISVPPCGLWLSVRTPAGHECIGPCGSLPRNAAQELEQRLGRLVAREAKFGIDRVVRLAPGG